MFWLSRPPYLRWIAAGLVLIAALWLEVDGRRTVAHPFLTRNIARGEVVTAGDLEWRTVPRGVLVTPEPTSGIAAGPLREGDPLLPSSLAAAPRMPAGWWALALVIPTSATTGSEVRLIDIDTGTAVDGFVVAPASGDGFSPTDAGLVAVPGEEAARVARAAATDSLVVLIAP